MQRAEQWEDESGKTNSSSVKVTKGICFAKHI